MNKDLLRMKKNSKDIKDQHDEDDVQVGDCTEDEWDDHCRNMIKDLTLKDVSSHCSLEPLIDNEAYSDSADVSMPIKFKQKFRVNTATNHYLENHKREWKGRNQQKIHHLQNKDMQRISRSSLSFSFDSKSSLRSIQLKEQRKPAENLEKELEQTKSALENNKKSLGAAKARIKVLENNLNISHRDLLDLKQKKTHDDELIEALSSQVRSIENYYCTNEIKIKKYSDQILRENQELKNELNAVKYQIEQLRKKLKEREAELEMSNRFDSFENKLELNAKNPSSIDENRHVDDLECITNIKEYITLAHATEAERKRLLELIAILNQRLDKEKSDTDHLSALYREEKQKRSNLERKLLECAAMKTTSKVNSGYRKKLMHKSLSNFSPSNEQLNLEQMQYKIELLEEECLALKTRLTTLRQEKNDDFVMYKRMIEQSKEIIEHSCRDGENLTSGRHSALTI